MKSIRLVVFVFVVFILSGCGFIRQDRFEWPRLKGEGELVIHTYYAVTYNPEHNVASWAAYSLTKEETRPFVKRKYTYMPDTLVSTGTAEYDDYRGSGYDRGHLLPARDMLFNETASYEVNFMSNITPQAPAFNRGIWRSLEQNVRYWAQKYDSVMVVSGSILEKGLLRIGRENKITVPNKYFKTILIHNDTISESIGFVIPNYQNKNNFRDDLFDYAVSVDKLEKMTGLDFWPMLWGRRVIKAENKYNLEIWEIDD
ncbi:MAG: DNA/RNA non-specific endonuclease [Candidatus Delongbacteria bacterium]|jgi:endonuclease G|nr:DNA/RNA non-specific endonuclease [Candidatus Delongbacteria bacterium]